MVKMISNLERDRKISMFAMSPTKEMLKKMQTMLSQHMGSYEEFIQRCKSERDDNPSSIKRAPSMRTGYREI